MTLCHKQNETSNTHSSYKQRFTVLSFMTSRRKYYSVNPLEKVTGKNCRNLYFFSLQ